MSNSCFIHSSTDGNLGCFQILDIINNVSMNIGMLMFFQISVLGFFRYIPRSGITGSKGRSIFIYLFIYLSVIYLSIYLSIIYHLSIYLFIYFYCLFYYGCPQFFPLWISLKQTFRSLRRY